MSSHPWFHPENVHADHRQALQLMVEILEAAVKDALPEARRRHPLPGLVPGGLLSPLVRDGARSIGLSPAFHGQSLQAVAGRSMGLHLWTWDSLLRIRLRKMVDPETPVPNADQLELPFDYAADGLMGQMSELGLFWAVKEEALYRVVLAAPKGWEDPECLSTWYGAVEVKPPVKRSLVLPLRRRANAASDEDDLTDVVERRQAEGDADELPGDAG